MGAVQEVEMRVMGGAPDRMVDYLGLADKLRRLVVVVEANV
jgi:hypothetical protein